MTETPTLLAKVKMQVEKSFLFQQLDSAMKKYQAEGVGGVMSGAADKTSDLLQRGLQQTGQMLGRIVKTLGKVAVGVLAAASLVEVFTPIFKLVDGIFKAVREFVRPVADVMMFLVKPILVMLRPVVQMFRTLMQPFREIATRGLAAANQLIAQGVQMGGEEGREMVGEGLKGAVSSASLMLSGFFEVIFKPVAELFRLGDRFDKLMGAWQSSAIEGITRTQILSDTFRNFNSIMNDTNEAAAKALSTIDTQMKTLNEKVDEFSMDNIPTIMENANQEVDKAVSAMGMALADDDEDFQKAFKKAQEVAEETGKSVEEIAGKYTEAANTYKNFVDNIKEYTDGLNIDSDETKIAALKERFRGLGREIDELQKPGLSQKAKDFWEGVTSPGEYGEQDESAAFFPAAQNLLGRGIESLNQAEAERQNEISSLQQQSLNTVRKILHERQKAEESGYLNLFNLSNDYLGNSHIPKSFKSGLQTMLNETNDFADGLREVSNRIKSYADEAKRAASQASSAATSARSATRQIGFARSF